MDKAQELAVQIYSDGQFGGAGAGGFVGQEPERLWLYYIVKAIQIKKAKKYTTTPTKILLYSNSNAGGHVDDADAFRIIGECVRANSELCRMNQAAFEVSILRKDSLLFDIDGGLRVLPVVK